MNKRGQVYLIFSLIIGLVVFILSEKANVASITFTDDDFKEISQNYNQESSRFIGELIKNGIPANDVKEQFKSFSILFTYYSQSQNPSFGLIYFLGYEDKVVIGNFLDEDLYLIDSADQTKITDVLKGCFSIVPVNINYGSWSFQGGTTSFNSNLAASCTKEISFISSAPIKFKIGNEEVIYEVNVRPQQPEVAVISREAIYENRKVFVEDQFIKGNKIPEDIKKELDKNIKEHKTTA